MIFPLAYLLFFYPNEYRLAIIVIIILMFITDLLDGYTARKYNLITETGKIIDPLADKIAIISLAVIIFLQGKIPVWFFTIVVLRDILILTFGLYLKRKRKVVLMSNYPGKIAVLSIGLILLFTVINNGDNELFKQVMSFLYYISSVLIIYSTYLYFIRFIKNKED